MQAQLARMARASRQKALDAQSHAEKNAVAARNEEIRVWIKVQDELPEFAHWLTEIGRVFKPSEEGRKKGKKALSIAEVTNLETGEFFKLR